MTPSIFYIQKIELPSSDQHPDVFETIRLGYEKSETVRS
jgi:hypothetical protein